MPLNETGLKQEEVGDKGVKDEGSGDTRVIRYTQFDKNGRIYDADRQGTEVVTLDACKNSYLIYLCIVLDERLRVTWEGG